MKNRSLLSLATLSFILMGCVTPQYHQVDRADEELKPTDVNFKVLDDFYNDPPACAAVMKAKADANPELGEMISKALARYLGEKVDRVIFPRNVKASAKRNGFDLADKTDRRRFAARERCRYYAVAELYDFGDDYVGVFAKKHVGVRIDLKRMDDDRTVWQAAHTVWRADGGVPVSPLGAIGGIASATYFNNDQEIVPSLVDDAMRRMIRTLPAAL